jgi:hypothetical protein
VLTTLEQEDKGKKHRGFADFFPLDTTEFQKRVPIITMEEFVRREGGKNGRLPVPEKNRTIVEKASSYCIKMKKSECQCSYSAMIAAVFNSFLRQVIAPVMPFPIT